MLFDRHLEEHISTGPVHGRSRFSSLLVKIQEASVLSPIISGFWVISQSLKHFQLVLKYCYCVIDRQTRRSAKEAALS